MKTKEELNALKEDVETLNRKLAELSEDELKEVVGGVNWLKDESINSGDTHTWYGIENQGTLSPGSIFFRRWVSTEEEK